MYDSAQRCVLPVFFFGGFTTMAVINQPEKKLAKRTGDSSILTTDTITGAMGALAIAIFKIGLFNTAIF